jgi:serine/threonine protein phosphatase PrpC
VHKFVSDEQIADVVTGGISGGSSLETICDALVHAAKRNGSHDDASALLVLRRPWFTPRWAYACALAAVLLLWFLLAHGEEPSASTPSPGAQLQSIGERMAQSWRDWTGV